MFALIALKPHSGPEIMDVTGTTTPAPPAIQDCLETGMAIGMTHSAQPAEHRATLTPIAEPGEEVNSGATGATRTHIFQKPVHSFAAPALHTITPTTQHMHHLIHMTTTLCHQSCQTTLPDHPQHLPMEGTPIT